MLRNNPDYKDLTDEQLIFKFQEEDVEAFNEIVLRYKDKGGTNFIRAEDSQPN